MKQDLNQTNGQSDSQTDGSSEQRKPKRSKEKRKNRDTKLEIGEFTNEYHSDQDDDDSDDDYSEYGDEEEEFEDALQTLQMTNDKSSANIYNNWRTDSTQTDMDGLELERNIKHAQTEIETGKKKRFSRRDRRRIDMKEDQTGCNTSCNF